jgi:hypothetical protein
MFLAPVCATCAGANRLYRGGNDPAIVLDDVNIDEVAPKVDLLCCWGGIS